MGRWLSGISLVALLLAGCAGAPVQEMSNARQSIDAARLAGAAERAPGLLEEAETLLRQAEDALEAGAFDAARDDARAADSVARRAREMAAPDGGRPSPVGSDR